MSEPEKSRQALSELKEANLLIILQIDTSPYDA
jgi:hypothetical protein